MRLKGALLRAACTASLSLFLIFACISLAAELEEQTEAVTAVSDAIAPEWEQPEALEAAAYTPPTRTAATTTTATATTAATATAAATTGATATATATATDQTEASVADSAAAAAPLFNPEEPVLLDRREENIPDAVAAAFTATLPHKVKRKQLLAGLALSLIGSLIAGLSNYKRSPSSTKKIDKSA
ncbi:hypothetical protein Emed_006568 [Eimeria media]